MSSSLFFFVPLTSTIMRCTQSGCHYNKSVCLLCVCLCLPVHRLYICVCLPVYLTVYRPTSCRLRPSSVLGKRMSDNRPAAARLHQHKLTLLWHLRFRLFLSLSTGTFLFHRRRISFSPHCRISPNAVVHTWVSLDTGFEASETWVTPARESLESEVNFLCFFTWQDLQQYDLPGTIPYQSIY